MYFYLHDRHYTNYSYVSQVLIYWPLSLNIVCCKSQIIRFHTDEITATLWPMKYRRMSAPPFQYLMLRPPCGGTRGVRGSCEKLSTVYRPEGSSLWRALFPEYLSDQILNAPQSLILTQKNWDFGILDARETRITEGKLGFYLGFTICIPPSNFRSMKVRCGEGGVLPSVWRLYDTSNISIYITFPSSYTVKAKPWSYEIKCREPLIDNDNRCTVHSMCLTYIY